MWGGRDGGVGFVVENERGGPFHFLILSGIHQQSAQHLTIFIFLYSNSRLVRLVPY